MKSEINGDWAVVRRTAAPLRDGDRLEVLEGGRWVPAKLHSIDADLAQLEDGRMVSLGPGSRVRFTWDGASAPGEDAPPAP